MEIDRRKIFAENLKNYMRQNKKKRNDICHDLGYKYSTVRDWDSGISYPRPEVIDKLADYFDIPIVLLIEDHSNIDMETVADWGYKTKDGILHLTRDRKLEKVVSGIVDNVFDEKYAHKVFGSILGIEEDDEIEIQDDPEFDDLMQNLVDELNCLDKEQVKKVLSFIDMIK